VTGPDSDGTTRYPQFETYLLLIELTIVVGLRLNLSADIVECLKPESIIKPERNEVHLKILCMLCPQVLQLRQRACGARKRVHGLGSEPNVRVSQLCLRSIYVLYSLKLSHKCHKTYINMNVNKEMIGNGSAHRKWSVLLSHDHIDILVLY